MKAPTDIPERILTIGNYGTGKSQSWVSWAYAQRLSGEGHTYVVNADRYGMVEAANAKYDDWASNVTHEHVDNWLDLRATTELYVKVAQPGDLVVIDGIEYAWQWVRDLYVETEHRKAHRVLDDNDPFATLPEVKMDWNESINPAYMRFFNLVNDKRNPAHVMYVGAAQPIKVKTENNAWGDDQETVDLFSQWGVRPAGQKALGRSVNTVLLATKRREGFVLDTMKETDTTRPYMVREKIPSEADGSPNPLGWVTTYLIGRAGFTL